MSSNDSKQPTIYVASSDAPNDFKEITISSGNNLFFKALSTLQNEFEEIGIISGSSLAKFRDSTPLARHRLRELKGIKKKFFKELEADAKKGDENVAKSLRFYQALLEADRLRSTKGQTKTGEEKPGHSGKA